MTKINYEKQRKTTTKTFKELEVDDYFYYEWDENDIRIKVSDESYYSFMHKKLLPYVLTVGYKYIKVKAEITVWRG